MPQTIKVILAEVAKFARLLNTVVPSKAALFAFLLRFGCQVDVLLCRARCRRVAR